MVEVVRDAIRDLRGWRYPPKVLEFSGLKDEEEKTMLRDLEAPGGREWEGRFE